MVCVGAKLEREEFGKTEARGRRPVGRKSRSVLCSLLLLALLMGFGGSAQAAPFIPFDGPEFGDVSFGFTNPNLFGITEFRTMDNYYQAASPSSDQAAVSMLHIDPVSFERCARSRDNCDSDRHVFDVVWDVTFNADVLDDPTMAYDGPLMVLTSPFSSTSYWSTPTTPTASSTTTT